MVSSIRSSSSSDVNCPGKNSLIISYSASSFFSRSPCRLCGIPRPLPIASWQQNLTRRWFHRLITHAPALSAYTGDRISKSARFADAHHPWPSTPLSSGYRSSPSTPILTPYSGTTRFLPGRIHLPLAPVGWFLKMLMSFDIR